MRRVARIGRSPLRPDGNGYTIGSPGRDARPDGPGKESGDIEIVTEANTRFHYLIGNYSGNEVLIELIAHRSHRSA